MKFHAQINSGYCNSVHQELILFMTAWYVLYNVRNSECTRPYPIIHHNINLIGTDIGKIRLCLLIHALLKYYLAVYMSYEFYSAIKVDKACTVEPCYKEV